MAGSPLVNFKMTHRYLLAVDVDVCLVISGVPISRAHDPDTDGVVRRSPVWFYPCLIVYNSERFLVFAYMDSHCEIDSLAGPGMFEADFRMNPVSRCMGKPGVIRRVLERCDVGSAAGKKYQLRNACVH